ncbi:hypothetical protein E4U13_004404, partial [Claviceps humidiphila]
RNTSTSKSGKALRRILKSLRRILILAWDAFVVQPDVAFESPRCSHSDHISRVFGAKISALSAFILPAFIVESFWERW